MAEAFNTGLKEVPEALWLLLEKTLVTEPWVHSLVTLMRKRILMRGMEGPGSWTKLAKSPWMMKMVFTIAAQAHMGGYLYRISKEEEIKIKELQAEMPTTFTRDYLENDIEQEVKVAVLASYRPMSGFLCADLVKALLRNQDLKAPQIGLSKALIDLIMKLGVEPRSEEEHHSRIPARYIADPHTRYHFST